jgi:hypothetical protein
MSKSGKGLSLAAALAVLTAVTGCESPQQSLQDEQGAALQTAVQRGRFELGCPAATGTVLSSDMLQPVLWGGTERAEYQIGVEGCGKRATYVVVCPMNSISCVAAAGQSNAQIQN